ncbi:uncharacterized protein PAC_14539 [Phialocephala subalpina]|uniref:DUF6594 domain-containing protein n=1 Tax=Phialocephala subalpina TaxID=576137 RepID=A0A1L7XHY7_9HELO|nr:uncharacterized protein PAC_14539 [Phialocephala subalpina]
MAAMIQTAEPPTQRSANNAHDADQHSGDLVLSIEPEMTNSEVRRRMNVPPLPNENEDSPAAFGHGSAQDTLEGSPNSQVSSSPWILRRLSTTFASTRSSTSKAEAQRLLDEKHGYNTFIKENYLECPKGLPQLASFISSCDDFSIYRGFKTIHERLILHLMVEITELEKQLDSIDRDDEKNPATSDRLIGVQDPEPNSIKSKVFKNLGEKIKEYDELVFNHCRMQALGEPPPRNRLSYFNWIWINTPLMDGSDDFIRHQGDFVKGVGGRSNYFEEVIKNHVYESPRSIFKRFLKSSEGKDTENSVTYYSEGKMDHLRHAMSVSLAIIVLLAPVFLLFLVPMTRVKMVFTAAAFIVPFAMIMSYMTGAKDAEVFIGTATYAALLIVFLGNISGSNASYPSPAVPS